MRAASDASGEGRSRLKNVWLRMLQAGAGSVVVATAVLAAPPAEAARPDASATVMERAEEARVALQDAAPALDASAEEAARLAWWGNWHNWGWHPGWHNWPNWHNWHNWHNWGNW